MNAKNFKYDNEKLSDYGMIICSFNGAGGLETVSSGSDITFSQIKASGTNRFHLYSSSYDEVYTSTFQICKNPCYIHNQKEMMMTVSEISSIQRWLCRKNQYKKFKIYQKGYEHIYWNAVFSAKQIEQNGYVMGMELTMYTDAPFAYMDDVVIEKECTTNHSPDIHDVPGTDGFLYSFDIYDISDEEGFLYPDVTITLRQSGDFYLKNSLNNKITNIKNCKSGEIIKLDGTNQIITTNSSEHQKTLPNDFNYYFPQIRNTYTENKNTFQCSLSCDITISYSPIRKIGL